MIKLVYVSRRQRDLSLEECRSHWREIHALLFLRYAAALRAVRYVQAHTIQHPLSDALRASRGDIEPYDGVAQVWWKDRQDLVAALGTPEGESGAAELLEDERRFIDHSRSSLWLAREHVFIDEGPEKRAARKPGSITKLFFAFRRLPTQSLNECQSYWREHHGRLVLRRAPAFPLCRYVQTHTLADPLNDMLRASRAAEEPYDGVAEMEADLEELVTAAGASAEAAQEFLADERRFIDPSRSSLWLATEHVVLGS